MTPRPDPILAPFAALRARRPDPPIVVRGKQRITAEELWEMSRLVAAALPPVASEPGAVVALACQDPTAFLAGFLALRRRGSAALLLDASSPKKERLRVVSEMGAVGVLGISVAWPDRRLETRFDAELEPTTVSSNVGEDVAVIKLTSGSTGRPRGILTPSEALAADEEALAESMDIGPDERILAALPLSHSYGLSSVALPALMRGSVLVVPDEASPMSPILAAQGFDVTFLPTVPAFLGALVRLNAPPPLPSTLRRIISAGAVLPSSTAGRFREVFGRPVQVFYGSSECGGICYDREGNAAEMGSVGEPVAGVRIDLEATEALQQEGGGRVAVESRAVARRYFPDPHPRLEGGRFRSRDLGRWVGGRLELLGRIDDLINVRGKKVNPREIESVIRRFDGVEEVAALGVAPDGGGDRILRAVIACSPGAVDVAGVRAWCRRHLADHKVPRSVILIGALPRTERGKIDQRALAALRGADSPSADGDG